MGTVMMGMDVMAPKIADPMFLLSDWFDLIDPAALSDLRRSAPEKDPASAPWQDGIY